MPPIRTKSTSCVTSTSSRRRGQNSGRSATVPLDEPCDGGTVVDPLGRRHQQRLRDQRAVVPPVDLAGLEHELLVHQPKQLGERRDSGRDQPALDPGDGGLRRAGADRELPLAEAVAAARGTEDRSGSHTPMISDLTSIVVQICSSSSRTSSSRSTAHARGSPSRSDVGGRVGVVASRSTAGCAELGRAVQEDCRDERER